MNDLIARAGRLFVAPAAAPVAFAPPRARCRSAGVLAPAAELAAAAGAVAAELRDPSVVVCVWRARWHPAPALPAAARLAAALRRRELPARAAGALCVVELPEAAGAAVAMASMAMAAADAPAVIAMARRDAAFDALLTGLDGLVLAPAPGSDPALAELAFADLQRMGPPVERRSVPEGALARRLAALGVAGRTPAEVPA